MSKSEVQNEDQSSAFQVDVSDTNNIPSSPYQSASNAAVVEDRFRTF